MREERGHAFSSVDFSAVRIIHEREEKWAFSSVDFFLSLTGQSIKLLYNLCSNSNKLRVAQNESMMNLTCENSLERFEFILKWVQLVEPSS